MTRFPVLGNWLTLGTALLAASGVWLLAGIPVEVKRVKVSGIRYLSPAQVERIAGIKPRMEVGRREAREVREVLEKHKAVIGASVSAGVTGTLHIRIKERVPVAWLAGESCAIAEDGIPLRHITSRDPSWATIAAMGTPGARAFDPKILREAVEGEALMRTLEEGASGAWYCRLEEPRTWLWLSGGKRVVFSSPVSEDEVTRLGHFRRVCPKAWQSARMLDMRFADRVVVKR